MSRVSVVRIVIFCFYPSPQDSTFLRACSILFRVECKQTTQENMYASQLRLPLVRQAKSEKKKPLRRHKAQGALRHKRARRARITPQNV